MEDQLTTTLTPAMLAILPVAAAIIQVLKRIPMVAKIGEWLPFVAIGISVALCFALQVPSPILPGVIIGLAASGGYDAVKTPTVLTKANIDLTHM